MATRRHPDEEQPVAPLEEPLLDTSPADAPAPAVTYLTGGVTGVRGCTVLLAKAIVGAGAAALPMAFARLGIFVSVAFLLLIAFMTHFSLEALTSGIVASGTHSYPSAVAALLGRGPAAFLEVCLVARCAGLIIVYIVIAADLLAGSTAHHLPGLLCEILPGSAEAWCGNRRLVAGALTATVLVPLVFPRRISSARWSSFLGLAAVGLWTVVTAGLAALAAARGTAHVPSPLPDPAALGGGSFLSQLTMALSTLPILGTAYTAQMTIGFIASELKGFSSKRMTRVSAGAVFTTSVVFLVIGLGSIVAFGTGIPADVLEEFGKGPLGALVGPRVAAVLGAAVRFGFLMSILANVPFQMLPYRQSLARLTLGGDNEFAGLGYFAVTYISLALFYAVAMAAKSIWVPIQLVGATAGAAIAFFYPAAVALAVAREPAAAPAVHGGYYWVNAWALVVAGAVQVVTGTAAVWLGENGKGGGDGGNGFLNGLRWPAL
jgi:sodium-coupled neutral amino acid transporter 2